MSYDTGSKQGRRHDEPMPEEYPPLWSWQTFIGALVIVAVIAVSVLTQGA